MLLNVERQSEGGTLASVIIDITITCGTMQYFLLRNLLIFSYEMYTLSTYM